MKYTIIILLFSCTLWGQSYKTAYIKSKADSLLRSYIGDSIFKYVKFSSNTYYIYKDKSGKEDSEDFNKSEQTKGKFVEVNMQWQFAIPYNLCTSLDTIKGWTNLLLDNKLRTIKKPSLSEIPDFFWRKENCDFLITKEKAIEIAKKDNLGNAVKPIRAFIEYTGKYNDKDSFKWFIYNYLSYHKDYMNMENSEVEIIEIDAITGHIISHETMYMGPVR